MKKIFSNKDIYWYADSLNRFFNNEEETINLPIKFNFYLQKNIKAFSDLAEEIEKARLSIGRKYGDYDADQQSFTITDKDKLALAQQDLENLLELEQNIDVMMVNLDDLGNVQLTSQQMRAILFMIEDPV